MLQRSLASLTILSLLSCSVSAQTLADAVGREARRQTPAPAARASENPHKKMALGLMVGGAALLVVGLAQDRGVKATTNNAGTTTSVSETGGSKTALEVLGIAMAAGGGFLYWQGEQKRRHPMLAPTVRVSRDSVRIGTRFSF